MDRKVVLQNLSRSAITTGEPSLPTRNVLFERSLFDGFAAEPEAALAELECSRCAPTVGVSRRDTGRVQVDATVPVLAAEVIT
jgi:hypothetical protein